MISNNEPSIERAARERRLLVISRFARAYRRQILSLIERSSRLEDLAQSFPALLLALASGYATADARARSAELVTAGAPLRAAAATLGLPWWLRRFAPEALGERLPVLPCDPEFDLGIANLVPAEVREAPLWLTRVAHAAEACDMPFALWMARQRRLPPGFQASQAELMIAAWAWHCGMPDTSGHRLVRAPWSETMSLKRALQEARTWLRRIDLAITLEHGIADGWYPAGQAGGFDIMPLTTLADFLTEAEVLDNCLDQYADQIRAGGTRLFSIRRAGVRIATMELCAHEDDSLVPRITQLRGPRNKRTAPEVWQAALLWLSMQRFRPLTAAALSSDRAARLRAWRSFWHPYLATVRDTKLRTRIETLITTLGQPAAGAARPLPRGEVFSRHGGR